jgi:SEL1 protein
LEAPDLIHANYSCALEYFLKAESLGSAEAKHNLAVMYGFGFGIPRDEARAITYEYFAAVDDVPEASMALGFRHFFGIGVPKSCQTASQYYSRLGRIIMSRMAKEAPPLIERINIAKVSSKKQRSTSLESDVLHYYEQKAAGGEVDYQQYLGELYYHGIKGVPRDYSKAFHYYSRATDNGDVESMARLGNMYLQGLGVAQNNESAIKWFTLAGEQGNPVALTGLGYVYLHGYGVEKNPATAFKFFKKAADAHYPDAQYAVGKLYYTGEGVEKSFTSAHHYYSLASHQYHPRALYHLGMMYLNGVGTRESCTMGVEMHKLLAERGEWATVLNNAYSAFKSGDYEHALFLYLRAASEVMRYTAWTHLLGSHGCSN